MSTSIVRTKFVPARIFWALCAAVILSAFALTSPALADDDRRGHGRGQWSHGHDGKHAGKHYKHHKHQRKNEGWHRGKGRSVVIWHGHRHWSPPRRHVQPVQRPHRHTPGNRQGSRDNRAP